MKTLYLDCGMGAAGDMLTAALLELLPDPDAFVGRLNALGIPGVHYAREAVTKCGIRGTAMRVTVHGAEEHSHDHPHDHAAEHDHGHEHLHGHAAEHDHGHEHLHDHGPEHSHEHPHDHGPEHDHGHDHAAGADHPHDHPHHHSTLADIGALVGALPLPAAVQRDILAVYELIAAAEGQVHGRPVAEVHFHEVGALDAVADITAVCLLLHTLAPQRVVASPVHVGCGQVRCAHGILPVPAPATACLLQGVPIYGGTIEGELCTPTGAALLKHFADSFGPMPVLRTEAIGCGMGHKDFAAANCLRAFWGESEDEAEEMVELSCNVDDMTAEEIGFAMEQLFAAGAREVYTIPIGMKKSRPGTLLRVQCTVPEREKMLALLFRHTTTLGVRQTNIRRFVLQRQVETVDTPCGPVRRKSAGGYGAARQKWEYEDLARIARERGLSLAEVRELLEP